MRTREVADICGVTEECIRQNAKKVGIVLENGKAHEYTEDELKGIQLQLMKNQTSQGKVDEQSNLKRNLQIDLEVGLAAKACLDSPEAWEQFKLWGDKFQEQKKEIQLEQQKNKELEEKNQLLIEQNKEMLVQKEAAEAETARIFQYNKNFHSQLYTATDLAKMLGTSANKIGRIAREQNLKQEPIYGKLGKIQLKNGRWCDVFYYNDDAKLVIENNL